MGDYYNKTRSPLPVALLRGNSVSIGPKTWCYIPPEDEGTPSLIDALKKGFLVRAIVQITNPPSKTPPVVVPASEPSAAPAAAAEMVSSAPQSDIQTALENTSEEVSRLEQRQPAGHSKTGSRKGK